MPKKESGLRRPPKQERSRERVDEILGAAKKLIGEKGVDAVKMREIAALAGGPISSVYQYFPNKSAIIAKLYEQRSDEIYQLLQDRCRSVTDLDELLRAIVSVMDIYFEGNRRDPAVVDLLNAIQADKALMNVDLAETQRQAQLFCEIARPWIAPDRCQEFQRMTFLMFHLAGSTARLALYLNEEESRATLDNFNALIRSQLQEFSGKQLRKTKAS
jgi:AcrR family transcriptional regulator